LQIEAWKIGDSLPAPRFNIIAKPNDWAKVLKQSAAGNTFSELKLQQQAFFERVREYGEAHAKYVKSWQTPRPQIWYNVAIGSSQAHIELTVRSTGKKQVTVQIYVPDNKELYSKLYANSAEIEDELGFKLDWREMLDKKASRITTSRSGDILDAEQSQELVVWMVKTADAFARVFPKYLVGRAAT
jgi:Domain of unknown function (DUF4268)